MPLLSDAEFFGSDRPFLSDDEFFNYPAEDDTYLSGAKKVAENFPERMTQAAGGLMQEAGSTLLAPGEKEAIEIAKKGEDEGFFDNLNLGLGMLRDMPSYIAGQAIPEDSKLGRVKRWLSDKGSELFKGSAEEIKKNQPVGLSGPAQYGVDVTRGIMDMGPAIAAGAVTKSPGVTLGMMGGQVRGTKFGEDIEAGRTPGQATRAAEFHQLAEIIPESIPVTAILKRGSPFAKRLFDSTLGEGAQEVITSVLQDTYDAQDLEGMSLKDAMASVDWKNALYSGLVGMGVGGGLAAATHPFVKDEGVAPPPRPAEAMPEGGKPPDISGIASATNIDDAIASTFEAVSLPALPSADAGLTDLPGPGYEAKSFIEPMGTLGEIEAPGYEAKSFVRPVVEDVAYEGLQPEPPTQEQIIYDQATQQDDPRYLAAKIRKTAEGALPGLQEQEQKLKARQGQYYKSEVSRPQNLAMAEAFTKAGLKPQEAPKPQRWADARLEDENTRNALSRLVMADFEPGGGVSVVPDESTAFQGPEGRVIPGKKRTPSVNPPWVQSLLRAQDASVKEVRKVADKAVSGKTLLGKKQRRILDALLNRVEGIAESQKTDETPLFEQPPADPFDPEYLKQADEGSAYDLFYDEELAGDSAEIAVKAAEVSKTVDPDQVEALLERLAIQEADTKDVIKALEDLNETQRRQEQESGIGDTGISQESPALELKTQTEEDLVAKETREQDVTLAAKEQADLELSGFDLQQQVGETPPVQAELPVSKPAEKPKSQVGKKFTPTHELNDGTPVIATAEENVWQDSEGNEYEEEGVQKKKPTPKSLVGKKGKADQAESELYQWMANKEGGQTVGNQNKIVPLTRDLYEEYVADKVRDDWSYEKDQEAGNTHISLISKDSGKTWNPGIPFTGSLEDIRPTAGISRGWAKKVNSFDNEIAKMQGRSADSDASKKKPEITKQPESKKEPQPVAEATKEKPAGEKVDIPLLEGDRFKTTTGRITSAFPKTTYKRQSLNDQKLREWLKSEYTAEAESRGDDFNKTLAKSLDVNNWSQADGDGVNLYLFNDPEGRIGNLKVATEEPIRSYDGLDVTYEVETQDTGETFTVTVDAGVAISKIDQRLDALRTLRGCL